MTAIPADVVTVGRASRKYLNRLLHAFGLQLHSLKSDAPITGSYWGAPEAGIAGNDVFVRDDTPVHSLLHESCHVICMDPEVRASGTHNAGSDDLEEAAVCYLQILLADELPDVGRVRLMADMDSWGYSFRLGSTSRWFAEDATDARNWLLCHGIIDADDKPTFQLRRGLAGNATGGLALA